jgi:hypothetical protein
MKGLKAISQPSVLSIAKAWVLGIGRPANPLLKCGIKRCLMVLRPNSKVAALRALVAVIKDEEQRLFAAINSERTSAEEISKALNDLYTLWSTTALKLADIEEEPVTSAPSPSAAQCNHCQRAVSLLVAQSKTSKARKAGSDGSLDQ